MSKTNEEVTPDEILSLDVATKTGYYTIKDGGGVWNFTPGVRRNGMKQYKDFRDTLIRYVKSNGIKRIVVEDVNVGTHFVAMRKLSEFRGILREVCESLDIEDPIFINVRSIKKFLTGNGNASKKRMMKAVKNKYGIVPEDDNHADAIAVFYYHIKNPNKK